MATPAIFSTAARLPNRCGKDDPQESVREIQDTEYCQGEALLLQPSEYPGGSNMANGKRGSLVGAIP